MLRFREDDYEHALPQPEDVFLIIEVSDTTLRYDRQIKLLLYAEENISEVWILNLQENLLEVYRDPSLQGYQSVQILRAGESVAPLAFPDLSFRVEDFIIA